MEEAVSVQPPPLPPKTKTRSSGTIYSSPLPRDTVLAANSVDFDIPTSLGASTAFKDTATRQNHVVKILINPQNDSNNSVNIRSEGVSVKNFVCDVNSSPCIRISVNSDSDMIQNNTMMRDQVERTANPPPYFFFNQYNNCVMSSGQVSPSDTLDSGTCSDLDGTPPPLPKKKSGGGVSVTLIGSHKRAPSSSSGAEVDSDDNESSTSSISGDSLNSGKISPVNNKTSLLDDKSSSFLPQTLLQDIRQRNGKLQENNSSSIVDEKSYLDRQKESQQPTPQPSPNFDTDSFYDFHINEKDVKNSAAPLQSVVEDETFAGYKDLLGSDGGASTIRSAKGTVRGVKNRVRAGIATFLQINNETGKNYKEKDANKVVVYTTTMGILRDTYQACMKVKQILRTLLVKFEERDVFMSSEYQAEIQERMRCDQILIPQVFVDGQHIGDAETIERLNESGELRRILKPFKSLDACTTCKICGGYRLLPCPVCKGSKKSVHRNHFTAEFVALKCMNCDEVGLVRCSSC